MHVMGTNCWDFEAPPDLLVKKALEFADEVEAQGIARLRGAWIEPEAKRMWCTWDTDDLEALRGAFIGMNQASGLDSELAIVEAFYGEQAA